VSFTADEKAKIVKYRNFYLDDDRLFSRDMSEERLFRSQVGQTSMVEDKILIWGFKRGRKASELTSRIIFKIKM